MGLIAILLLLVIVYLMIAQPRLRKAVIVELIVVALVRYARAVVTFLRHLVR